MKNKNKIGLVRLIQENENLKNSEDEEIREFGDLANPILKYIYGIIQIHIVARYRLKISKTFWYLLTLGLFSCMLLVTGNSFYVPLLFFILMGLDFIYLNGGLVKEKIWPEESKKIDKFLSDIDNRKISNVLYFIRISRLNTKSIIRLLNTPFKDYSSVYRYILKYQWIDGELLDYIIKENLINQMGEDIFCIFLKRSNSDMSNSNYWKLMNEYRENAKVISILNLCYPSLLKNHKIFKYFANKSINIRDWFIYGIGNLFLFSSIFIIYLAWLVTTNQINYYILSESGESMYLLEWFNLILAIILASAFITLIIRWIIIKIVQERYILFYFSPKEPNNT